MQTGIYLMKTLACAGVFVFALIFIPQASCDGEIKDLKLFEYWDTGKTKKCTVFDVDGYLKAKAYCRYDGTIEKMERFDHYGNKTEEAFYDEKGRMREGLDGWAAMKWKYEGYQLVASITYDTEGVPLEKKYYSESGKLILRQYRDDDERFNPYEAAAMALMLGARNVPCEVTERKAQ